MSEGARAEASNPNLLTPWPELLPLDDPYGVPGLFCIRCVARNWTERSVSWNGARSIPLNKL